MKSKKLAKQAVSWTSYPNIPKETSLKKNSLVSVSYNNNQTTSDISIFVDLPITPTRNSSKVSEVLSPFQSFSSQSFVVLQPARVNVSSRTNMSIS